MGAESKIAIVKAFIVIPIADLALGVRDMPNAINSGKPTYKAAEPSKAVPLSR